MTAARPGKKIPVGKTKDTWKNNGDALKAGGGRRNFSFLVCSRRASAASLLRIAEEGASSGHETLTVTDSSPSPTRRKKSLTWKGDDDLCQAPVSGAKGTVI